MNSYRNTFSKLMNQDMGIDKFSPENYFELRNGRVISTNSLSTGDITPEHGNTMSFDIPQELSYNAGGPGGGVLDLSDLVVLAMEQTRDYLILFTTHVGNSSDTPVDTLGQIWRIKYDPRSKQVWDAAETALLNWGADLEEGHLLYHGLLNLSTANRITIVSQKENTQVHKIYWADGYNLLSHLNIIAPLAEIRALTIDQLRIVPNATLTRPMPTEVLTGGVYSAGRVQYSYQLFNRSGAETSFAPISPFMNLTEYSENTSDSRLYGGSVKETYTGKAVSVQVNNIDQSFDGIRIVSIYYGDISDTPEIRLIYENYITGSSLTIKDAGDTTLGVYTTQEINGLGSLLVYPKTIAVKDNILFVANGREEEYFDIDSLYASISTDPFWDSRAYRFNNTGSSYHIDGSTFDATATPIAGVTETADCKLPITEQYDWRYNGVTGNLGGSGVNVHYEFQLARVYIDAHTGDATQLGVGPLNNTWDTLDSSFPDTTGLGNFANSISAGYVTGYTRDELYAFALVVRDTQGRKSYPKWIADIKMPAMCELDVKETYNIDGVGVHDYKINYEAADGSNYGLSLGLKFTVDLSVFGENITSWEIVRLKREDDDKTIIDQGIVTGSPVGLINENINYYATRSIYTGGLIGGENSQTEIVEFSGPYTNFNATSTKVLVGDYIQEEAAYSCIQYEGEETESQIMVNALKLISSITNSSAAARVIHQIVEGKFIKTVNPDRTNLGPHIYNNITTVQEAGNDLHETASKRTALIAFYRTDLTALGSGFGGAGHDRVLICNYKRDLANQYGGSTHADRTLRNYITTNCTKLAWETVGYAYGGDTYVTYYDHQRIVARNQDGHNLSRYHQQMEVNLFPVECTVNLDLRHDLCFTKMHNLPPEEAAGIQEIAGVYSNVGPYWGLYTQVYDSNIYNTVYSQESTVIVYPAQSLLDTEIKIYDSRIRRSGQKIYGELSDSWVRFLTDNKMDVQSNYGAINALHVFQDRLMFVQDHALGVASVNERGISVNIENASEVVLGSGGILDALAYVSTKYGTRHQFSVESSLNGLYFFDSASKAIISYSGGEIIPLSTAKGMNSWLYDNIHGDLLVTDKTCQGIGVHTGYDVVRNCVYFTFLDSTIQETISYSEYGGGFESFYDFNPHMYGKVDGIVLSCDPNNYRDVYVHDYGTEATFYGTTYDTAVTVLANPMPSVSKVFSNVTYVQNVDKLGVDLDDTFYKYEAWNQYQTTGEVTLVVDTNVKRKQKVRVWKFMIDRDILDQKARLRDTFMLLKLYYDNSSNNTMRLHDVLVYFLPHMR